MENPYVKILGRSLVVLALLLILIRSIAVSSGMKWGRQDFDFKSTERPEDFIEKESLDRRNHRSVRMESSTAQLPGSAGKPSGNTAARPWVKGDFTHLADEVSSFSLLQRKILRTEAEDHRLKILKKHPEYFPLMKRVLLNPAEAQVSIDPLLDYVFAMVQDGEPGAKEMLLEVLQDPAVEKRDLGNAVYDLQTEIRAEIMWRLAAGSHFADSEIRNILPGSVSLQIWQNVQRWQERNIQESRQLAAGYSN